MATRGYTSNFWSNFGPFLKIQSDIVDTVDTVDTVHTVDIVHTVHTLDIVHSVHSVHNVHFGATCGAKCGVKADFAKTSAAKSPAWNSSADSPDSADPAETVSGAAVQTHPNTRRSLKMT